MGHLRYLQGNLKEARDCYQRTLSFIADAREMHSIYLRLASIYLHDTEVRNYLVKSGDCRTNLAMYGYVVILTGLMKAGAGGGGDGVVRWIHSWVRSGP